MKPARKPARRPRSSPGAQPPGPQPKSEVIELPADCSARQIDALRGRLCAIAADVRNVTLDLRRLERFDTTTLQLIAAFARDQSARGTNVLTCGNRPAWDEAAVLLGLSATLAGTVAAQ